MLPRRPRATTRARKRLAAARRSPPRPPLPERPPCRASLLRARRPPGARGDRLRPASLICRPRARRHSAAAGAASAAGGQERSRSSCAASSVAARPRPTPSVGAPAGAPTSATSRAAPNAHRAAGRWLALCAHRAESVLAPALRLPASYFSSCMLSLLNSLSSRDCVEMIDLARDFAGPYWPPATSICAIWIAAP